MTEFPKKYFDLIVNAEKRVERLHASPIWRLIEDYIELEDKSDVEGFLIWLQSTGKFLSLSTYENTFLEYKGLYVPENPFLACKAPKPIKISIIDTNASYPIGTWMSLNKEMKDRYRYNGRNVGSFYLENFNIQQKYWWQDRHWYSQYIHDYWNEFSGYKQMEMLNRFKISYEKFECKDITFEEMKNIAFAIEEYRRPFTGTGWY